MNKSKILYIAKLVGLLLSLYLIFEFALPVIAPFLVGYLLAILLDKPVSSLENKYKINRIVATILIISVITALLGFISYFLWLFFMNNKSMITDVYGNITHTIGKKTCQKVLDCMVDKLFDNMIPVSISICGIFAIIIVTITATILICINLPNIRRAQESNIFAKEIMTIRENLLSYLVVYIKAQGIIMVITSFVCVIGLYIAKNSYALVLGIGIGILDAFPVLGSGLILVPLAVYSLYVKNIFSALLYIVTWIICMLLRHVLEPKLMGGRLGISTLEALIGIYVGVYLWGMAGLILGPLAYLVVKKMMV